MAVIDLWYLRARGPNNRRIKSKRYGRGKRYRVDYTDVTGKPVSKSFQYEEDAKDFDAECRAGVAPEVSADRGNDRLTFPEYAARWMAARRFSWEVETRRRIPGNIAHHLNPAFPGPIRAITLTDVLEWISGRVAGEVALTPKSSMKLYYELFNTIMRSAEIDRVIEANPCKGVKLAAVFRGLSSAPQWVPTEAQVLDLFDVVPKRYHAALWLGAGQACRIGEVLGMEDAPHCLDFDNEELHVVQQLQYNTEAHGGFYLKPPKAGSAGTIEFDHDAMTAVRDHIAEFGATKVEVIDATGDKPTARMAALLFVDARGRPFHHARWSEYWTTWRKAAGWPVTGGTFHALRHFCATTMLTNGADPQHVQKWLRHASLQVTLSTYVHWLPRHDRPANIVSRVLRRAAEARGAVPAVLERV